MAFNPISIEDDGTRPEHGNDVTRNHTDAEATAVAGGDKAQVGGGLTADQLNDPTLLTSKTPLQTAVQRCLQHYYFEYVWQVAFPEEPATPLLYYPEVYTKLLTDPAATDIMQSELDAMGDGVLQRIPLTYYPLDPQILQETYAQALAVKANIEAMQQEAKAAGSLERLTWDAEDVNPALDPADAKLLDSDLDRGLLLQRDLPSLTLLQRPLYTDMGLVPQEQRHAARLARIVPQELRALTQSSAALPGSPMSPASPLLHVPLNAGATHGNNDGVNSGGAAGGATSVFDTAYVEAQEQEWQRGVQRSFRHVREMDRQFACVVQEVVQRKLGLDPAQPDHIRLGRALWQALFDSTTATQQRAVWHQLCHFSSNYGEQPHREATRALLTALSTQRLPRYFELWRPLLRRYTDGVEQYVQRLAGGVAERKSHLRFSGAELDPLYGGSFQPELTVGHLMQRRGTELGENRAPLLIYPVEMMPVFPSGYDKAAALPDLQPSLSEEGALDFLAEGAERLRHMVLPGAVVPAAARQAGPHVLVNGTNLLVADGAAVLEDGAAVSYHTSKENTYEPLLEDVTNTTSYLMRVVQQRQAGGMTEHEGEAATGSGNNNVAAAMKVVENGSTNHDGRCCVYDRIGIRADFVKATNVAAPPATRYVLLFTDHASESGQADAQQRATATPVTVNSAATETGQAVPTLKREHSAEATRSAVASDNDEDELMRGPRRRRDEGEETR